MVQRRRKFVKKGRQVTYSKSKKLVTGHGPTLLERIASGVGSAAKLAMAVAPAIAAINTEHKYWDQTAAVTSYAPGTNDQIIALTAGVVQGITDQTRIGNSILAQDLQIRLAHNFTTTLGAPNIQGIHCRMMLVCWKENATANPISAAKLFEVPNNLYSSMNKDYTDQFVVLKDKFFSLNNSSGLAGTSAFTAVKMFKPLKWHIRWDNANATQNHVFLILRSSAVGVGNALQTTYYSRLNFTDN